MAQTANRLHLALVVLMIGLGLWTGGLLLSYDAPFIDYAQHSFNLAVLRDPAAWADVYRIRMDPLGSNTPWFYLDRVLALFLSPTQSMGLGFTLAIVGLPLATGWWAHELKRDGWLAMVICAWVAWSGMIYWGFLHYTLGVVVGVAILALDRRLQRDNAGVIPLTVLWTLLFSLHTIAWAWTVVLVLAQRAVFTLVGKEPLERVPVLAGIAAVVPSGILVLRWAVGLLWRSGEMGTLGSVDQGLGLKFAKPISVLNAFITEVSASIAWSRVDDVLGVAILVLGGVGAIYSLRTQAKVRTETVAALTVGLLTTLAAFVLPNQMRGQYFLATRLIAFVPVAAAVLAAIQLSKKRRRVALAAAAVVALVGQVVQHQTVLRWHEETGPPRRLLETLPEGQTVMIWAHPVKSKVVFGQIYSHYPSLYAAGNKGRNAFSFAVFEPNPVIYVGDVADRRMMPGEEYRPWCAAFRGAATDVDVVLVRGRKAGNHCDARLKYQENLRELAREDEWTLYEVTTPLEKRTAVCSCTLP